MKKMFVKAKKIAEYLFLKNKLDTVSFDVVDKIDAFHKEFNKLGLGADFKTNQNAGTEPKAKFNGRECLMFASNNYLGLSSDAEVINKAALLLNKHGLGPGGSRFLCGNLDILEELDKKTAELVGMEDSITFPTGYMANLAVFQGIMDPLFGALPFQKGAGVIFSDEYNHGSIIDGCRLSYSKKITFRHNDLEDLRNKLIEHRNFYPKMIVTEGVFTPHGDMAPLNEIIKISKEFQALLMVDDAHGVGVLGKKGGGSTEYQNVFGQVDILMGSYDKALGGMGGFLAGKKKLIEYLRISSRPYVFSSSISAVMAGGLIEAINLAKLDQKRREKLFLNAMTIRTALKKMGYKILGSEEIPVILVYIGDENKSISFAQKILDNGIYCPSFRWPAVPQGASRIRITPMSTHTNDDITKLVSVFGKVGKEINLI